VEDVRFFSAEIEGQNTYIFRASRSLDLPLYHKVETQVQLLAFGVSFNLNLQSQCPWSLFKGTW